VLTRRNLTILFILPVIYTYNGLDQWHLSLDVEGYLAEYKFIPAGSAVTILVVLGPFHLFIRVTFSWHILSIGHVQ